MEEDFEGYYEERDNWVHADDVPDIKTAREKMEILLKMIYGKYDLEYFEDVLQEICEILGTSIPDEPITIQKI